MAAIHVGNDAGTSVVVRDVALEAMPYSLVRVRITVQAGELFGRVRYLDASHRMAGYRPRKRRPQHRIAVSLSSVIQLCLQDVVSDQERGAKRGPQFLLPEHERCGRDSYS